MKYRVLVTLFICSAFIHSCSKCSCESVDISGLTLATYQRSADSTATIDVYVKGSNFSKLDHSIPAVTIDSSYSGRGQLVYGFDYGHDYKITIHPSDKVYKLKDMSQTSKSESILPGTGPCDQCANGHSYSLNDSLYSYSEVSGSGGAVTIIVY